MLTYTTDQWVIIGLIFVLGLLIGMWLTSGGRRKWKTRYSEEVTTRKALEDKNKEREAHWSTREKEWREQDARREAALRSAPPAAGRTDPYVDDRLRDRHPDDRHAGDRPGDFRDVDRDGTPDNYDRRPLNNDRH